MVKDPPEAKHKQDNDREQDVVVTLQQLVLPLDVIDSFFKVCYFLVSCSQKRLWHYMMWHYVMVAFLLLIITRVVIENRSRGKIIHDTRWYDVQYTQDSHCITIFNSITAQIS